MANIARKPHVKLIVGGIATLAILTLIIFGWWWLLNPKVEGVVSRVVYPDNNLSTAEDGPEGYRIEVIDKHDELHIIEWESPGMLSGQGYNCVYIPTVEVGDRVEFRLPHVSGTKRGYDACNVKSVNLFNFTVK